MTELENVLGDFARRLEKAEIPYMVIGGMANAVWGIPRATLDIDVTALLDASRAEEVLCLLGESYSSRVGDAGAFVMDTRVLPLQHSSGVQIDLIFALLPFEEEAVRRSLRIDVVGIPVHFCTPEDLVLHKIVSERERDRSDLVAILERRRTTLDRSYLDPRVHELAVLLECPELEQGYFLVMDRS